MKIGKNLIVLGACLGLAAALTITPVRAQDAPPQPPAANPVNPAANNARTRPLSTVLQTISRASGVYVVADRTVIEENVAEPTAAVTAENVETIVGGLVKSLPPGTVWAKLYLPLPRGGRFDGDAVADLAMAQAKLYGNVGGTTPDGTIEVIGQKISGQNADAVTNALKLKTVYILTNPGRRTASADTPATANWTTMTPEQQRKSAQEQAQRLMNMDPTARAQYFQQQAAVMGALMQMVPPDQRRQFFESMGIGRGGFGGPGGGTGGGGGRGRRGGGNFPNNP